MTLGNLFVMLLLGAAAAWWWRAHGVRERALLLASSIAPSRAWNCSTRMSRAGACALARDHRGQWRLSREFGFEFTVSGEERYAGRIVMYGYHLGAIELAPHRFEAAAEVDNPPVHSAEVIRLDEWRQSRQKRSATEAAERQGSIPRALRLALPSSTRLPMSASPPGMSMFRAKP